MYTYDISTKHFCPLRVSRPCYSRRVASRPPSLLGKFIATDTLRVRSILRASSLLFFLTIAYEPKFYAFDLWSSLTCASPATNSTHIPSQHVVARFFGVLEQPRERQRGARSWRLSFLFLAFSYDIYASTENLHKRLNFEVLETTVRLAISISFVQLARLHFPKSWSTYIREYTKERGKKNI